MKGVWWQEGRFRKIFDLSTNYPPILFFKIDIEMVARVSPQKTLAVFFLLSPNW